MNYNEEIMLLSKGIKIIETKMEHEGMTCELCQRYDTLINCLTHIILYHEGEREGERNYKGKGVKQCCP